MVIAGFRAGVIEMNEVNWLRPSKKCNLFILNEQIPPMQNRVAFTGKAAQCFASLGQ